MSLDNPSKRVRCGDAPHRTLNSTDCFQEVPVSVRAGGKMNQTDHIPVLWHNLQRIAEVRKEIRRSFCRVPLGCVSKQPRTTWTKGSSFLAEFTYTNHQNTFLQNKTSSNQRRTWHCEKRLEMGAGRAGLEYPAWHAVHLAAHAKCWQYVCLWASLSGKWGQRITWWGEEKGPEVERLLFGRNLSSSPSQERKVLFSLFLLLNPQSLVCDEEKKREALCGTWTFSNASAPFVFATLSRTVT